MTPPSAEQGSPLLLVVDFQIGLHSLEYGRRNNASAAANAALLLHRWRTLGWPVVYTRHLSTREGSPLASGSPGRDIEPALAPDAGARVFDKTTNSAFKAPGLAWHVERLEPSALVIVGVATDACVTASAREAKDLGYAVAVVADACATFERAGPTARYDPDLVHAVSLSALAASHVDVPTTLEVLDRIEGDGPSLPP